MCRNIFVIFFILCQFVNAQNNCIDGVKKHILRPLSVKTVMNLRLVNKNVLELTLFWVIVLMT